MQSCGSWAKVSINAVPCKTYNLNLNCAPPGNITLPDIQATGVALAPGDTITAGDYSVIIQEIISGDPASYTGTGYIEMKLVAGVVAKRLGVDFSNLVVNECYEMASGDLRTMYDPDWSNIVDVDEALGLPSLLDKFIEIEKELLEFIDTFDGTQEHIAKLDKLVNDLQGINTSIQNNPDFDQLTKTSVQEETDGIVNKTYCLTGRTNPNGRVSSTLNACTWTPWTALAQCLGGAAIDVFMQYRVKWLELIADGNSKHFVNDFAYIKSKMPWKNVVASAATSCFFSALPIPVNKASYAIVATGALVGAAEGLSRNIIIQYNTLKDQYSFLDIPENMDWQSAFQEAAIQGISQAVVIAITRNLSQSQKLSRFAANLANKVKASPGAMRQLFRNAGLTDEVIEAIYTKLGVPVFKKIPILTFKPYTNGNKRYNLALITGRVLSEVTEEAHHVFSQTDQILLPHWNRLNINVHDPRFMQWWARPGHQQNDTAYRNMWRAFFVRYPNATLSQVGEEGRKIMAHFGFTVNY